MSIKEFFNQYWRDKTNGKYAEPYIDYVEHISKFYGQTPDFFLFFLLALEFGFENTKLVLWENVTPDFTSIKANDINGEAKTIVLPKILQNYLKENRKTNSKTLVLFNPAIQKIQNDISSFFLTDLNLGSVKEFPQKQAFIENAVQHIQQPNYQQTRACMHAWQRVEVGDNGGVAPCCNIKKIWHINDKEQLSQGYKHLRTSLLEGKLNYLCQTCYMYPVVDKEEFRTNIKTAHHQRIDDLTESLPTKELSISISEKCNLRCTYCAISENYHNGVHMEDVAFKGSLELVKNAAPDASVYLNGRGEATFNPKWQGYFSEMIATGRKIKVTTNLASKYSDKDYELLAQLDTIWVSLDSDDEEMTVRIRKKIRPQKVYENIKKIQDTAQRLNINSPEIIMSVGVYNPSIWKMDEFMQKLSMLNIQGVGFWQMKEVTSNKEATSIIHLTKEETQKARAIFYKSVQILKQNNLTVSIAQDLICSDGLPLYQENIISQNNKQPKKKPSLFQRLLGNSVTKKQ